MPTIPDFPFPTDDSGDGDDGTEVNLAWTEELDAAVAAVIFGADNPGVPASDIVDEVIEARGTDTSLDNRITNATTGVDNPGVDASDIIDEVIEARDGEVDLLTRVSREASLTDSGEVSTGAQEFAGAKTFDGAVIMDSTLAVTGAVTMASTLAVTGAATVKAGTASSLFAKVGGQTHVDLTPRTTSGTGETTLTTQAIPANTLSRNGQVLVIRAAGKLPANANNKKVAISFGGTKLIENANNANNDAAYQIELRIRRLTANTQVAQGRVSVGNASSVNATTAANGLSYFSTWDNLAFDLTTELTVLTLATAATAGTITQVEFEVSVHG